MFVKMMLRALLDWLPILFAWVLAVAMVVMLGWMFGVR